MAASKHAPKSNSRFSNRRSAAALVAAAGLSLAAAHARATVLTFDVTPYPELASLENPSGYGTYGDNVAALSSAGFNASTYDYLQGNAFTPNLVVDYTHQLPDSGHLIYKDGGAWPDALDYLRALDNNPYWFTFSSAGDAYAAKLNSFRVETYSTYNGPTAIDITWRIRANSTGGTILYSGLLDDVPPSTGTNITTGMADFHYGGPLVLEIVFSGQGNWGSVGIDDINFDQTPAPEPASLSLLGLGAAMMLKRKRR